MARVTVDAKPEKLSVDLDRAALLIIDMQRDFLEPGGFGETLGNDELPHAEEEGRNGIRATEDARCITVPQLAVPFHVFRSPFMRTFVASLLLILSLVPADAGSSQPYGKGGWFVDFQPVIDSYNSTG